MKQTKTFFAQIITFIFTLVIIGSLSAKAELKVVTTIKPLHSLITHVMDGIGDPDLIIEGSSSPHSFVLKPSHAKLIEQADIIFWIGEDIETFM
jgi:zinc transport system substrate-binding protein